MTGSPSHDVSSGKFATSIEAYHVTTKPADHRATEKTDLTNEFEDEKPRSPLAHGAVLLCLYIAMYLAVAALVHNVATLSAVMTAIESSLTNAQRALTAATGDTISEAASRRGWRFRSSMIDTDCD